MIQPCPIILTFAPENEYVELWIVSLTPDMADRGIRDFWWAHEDLKLDFGAPPPIDRNWDWNDLDIEYKPGEFLQEARVAIVAGEGEPIQGAMLISAEPVQSVLEPGHGGLFIELLFTAPWNRPNLRKDGQNYLVGVGSQLLTWGAWFSREKGCEGRLLLDSSPEQVSWYRKRGLQILGQEHKLHEDVKYTPMELPPEAAEQLIKKWDR